MSERFELMDVSVKPLFAKIKYIALLSLLVLNGVSSAQSGTCSNEHGSLTETLKLLQLRLEKVESELTAARAEAAASRQTSLEVERELTLIRERTASTKPSQDESEDERLELLNAKIDEQYQTKVESSSKYSLRVSGMVLLNAFNNRGFMDNMEDPTFAKEATLEGVQTNFGGTLRQTQLGFELFGPELFGGRTSGSLQFDFAGGYATTPSAATLGLIRLRTGAVRLDWEKTSLVIGQDGLFFAPNSPTSFASLQEPAMANSGQLWGWVPQIRLERKFQTVSRSSLSFQAGVLDPVSFQTGDGSGDRNTSVGERSHRPAVAARLAWSRSMFGNKAVLGFGHYRAQQIWGNSPGAQAVNSWVNAIDWTVPITHFVEVSGAYHHGRAIADLGGSLGQNVGDFLIGDGSSLPGSPSAIPANAVYKGLGSVGGWLQVKIKPIRRFEINIVGGEENRIASEVESAASTQDYFDQGLARNRTYMGNIIFRPRSNLVLSTEYRHVRSFPLGEEERTLDHINLGFGILF